MIVARITTFGVAFLLCSAVGCALSTTAADPASIESAVSSSETFAMFTDGASAREPCTRYVLLTLSPAHAAEEANGQPFDRIVSAHLEDAVTGDCELHIDRDARDYALAYAGESCGSTRLEARTTRNGAPRPIRLTDHRTRLCTDYRPFKLEVEDTAPNGEPRSLRSSTGDRGVIPNG